MIRNDLFSVDSLISWKPFDTKHGFPSENILKSDCIHVCTSLINIHVGEENILTDLDVGRFILHVDLLNCSSFSFHIDIYYG